MNIHSASASSVVEARLADFRRLALQGDAGELRFALERVYHLEGYTPGSSTLLRAMFGRLAVLLDQPYEEVREAILAGPDEATG